MPTITINGEPTAFPDAHLTVAELLARLGKDAKVLAVEVNREVVARSAHATHALRDGDAVEIATLVGGGAAAPEDKPLTVGKFTFRSRLFTGTGKYQSYELMERCMAASGCEVTTVAVRRERLIDKEGKSILDFLDLKALTILPNTAGCFSAEDAIRHARLARELLANLENPGAGWVKLECLADKRTLLPDPIDTLKATEQLVKDGFTVLVYPDYPVIVDAGVGTASDVSAAMELGCDGVLLNTAIASARDPLRMAHAMRYATEAGRLAYLAGRIPKRLYANASSPTEGMIALSGSGS
jgi:thiazole synthase